MRDPVELRLTTASSFPTGTGSYGYRQRFELVVRDLGLEKSVGIDAAGRPHAAHFTGRLADGRERWELETTYPVPEFSATYLVDGALYRDDGDGAGYHMPLVTDDFAALVGARYAIVLGVASLHAGRLTAIAGVRNLAFQKEVSLVYSTDGWATTCAAPARYDRTMITGLEVWRADAQVGPAGRVTFALRLRAGGQEHWDNNFGGDYTRISETVAAEVW